MKIGTMATPRSHRRHFVRSAVNSTLRLYITGKVVFFASDSAQCLLDRLTNEFVFHAQFLDDQKFLLFLAVSLNLTVLVFKFALSEPRIKLNR